MSLTKLKFIPLLAMALSASLTFSSVRADENQKVTRIQQGGLLPGETREQKRERLVAGIEKQVGTLTPEQKTHILAVLKAAGDEMAAARDNSALTPEQQSAVVSKVHGDVFNRFSAALTPEQQAKLKANSGGYSNDGAARTIGRGGRAFGANSSESFEQRRERLLKNYTDVLPDLTTKQKSDILAANEAASDEMAAIKSLTVLSDSQKKDATLKAHKNVAEKVDGILTDAQRVVWEKHRKELKTAREKEKTTVAKNN